jgi:very-short-patch-repair endonuclease
MLETTTLLEILEYKNQVAPRTYEKNITNKINSCIDLHDVPVHKISEYIIKYNLTERHSLTKKILNLCTELNEFENISEKFWAVKNKVYIRPVCEVCKGKVKFNKSKKRDFHRNCSFKCFGKNENIIEERKATNIKTYGVPCVQQVKEIKEKTIRTNIERYGNENSSSSPIVIERVANGLKGLAYDELKEEYSSVMTFNFSKEEYVKTKQNKYQRFSFTCLECNIPFDFYIANGKTPRCPNCHPKNISSHETNIREFFEDRYQLTSTSPRILNNKEIDIYFEELKLGIEYNGSYWHSSPKKEPTYHQDKSLSAKEQGIKLFHIWDDEWMNNKDKIINYIDSLAGKSKIIYARNTQVKEITYKEAHPFIENTHLKGNTKAKVYIGLFHNDVLVSCMSFGKPRFRKDSDWEIIRFCSSLSVIGGASKMVKYFRKHYTGSIITYADLDYSTGAVYLQCGFTLIDKTVPSYFYIKNEARYSRQQLQKKKLIKKYPELSHLTGKEILETKHYFKIYTSGSLVYRLD